MFAPEMYYLKIFFIFILTLTIYSYGINFMNAREQSTFSKYADIHHKLTSLQTASVSLVFTFIVFGLSPANNYLPH